MRNDLLTEGESSNYLHPGRKFVQQFGFDKDIRIVLQYIEFLRAEAGLGDEPPVDLGKIYASFKFQPRRASLPQQQGVLLNPEKGLIFINQDDTLTRQRYSEAHEIIELLFAASPMSSGWAARQYRNYGDKVKENLCEKGAAILLMPESSFAPRIEKMGISLETSKNLAEEYQVSLTAAMLRMVKLGRGSHAVILWRSKNKPTEIAAMHPKNQMTLFGEKLVSLPKRKLRIEWGIATPKSLYIPKDKSVHEDTNIYASWENGEETRGIDNLDLVGIKGECLSENLPFDLEDGRRVISLIHLPGDSGCD